MKETNHGENILKIFAKDKNAPVCWQPRIMLYYTANGVNLREKPNYWGDHLKIPWEDRNKFVPNEWIGKKIIEIHKELDASIRYPAESLGIQVFKFRYIKGSIIDRKIIENEDGSHFIKTKTPVGTVYEKYRGGHSIEKMVKNPEDLKVVKYLIENSKWTFNESSYNRAEKKLGRLGIPISYYFRSPYQKCILEYLGFERTTIWLKRKPELMEDLFQFMNIIDEKWYKDVILPSKVKILNFGENIDHNLSPPREFEKFLIPYYEERIKWIHNAKKYCFIHLDGSIKNLLPYLESLSFDGYEALTPEPQGDVTLEEIRDSIGNHVYVDGIPATLFMPHFPVKRLIECTEKILEYFAPNLILGVSDELPGNADGRRLRIVSDLVEKFNS